jgi:hypothetical protein
MSFYKLSTELKFIDEDEDEPSSPPAVAPTAAPTTSVVADDPDDEVIPGEERSYDITGIARPASQFSFADMDSALSSLIVNLSNKKKDISDGLKNAKTTFENTLAQNTDLKQRLNSIATLWSRIKKTRDFAVKSNLNETEKAWIVAACVYIEDALDAITKNEMNSSRAGIAQQRMEFLRSQKIKDPDLQLIPVLSGKHISLQEKFKNNVARFFQDVAESTGNQRLPQSLAFAKSEAAWRKIIQIATEATRQNPDERDRKIISMIQKVLAQPDSLDSVLTSEVGVTTNVAKQTSTVSKVDAADKAKEVLKTLENETLSDLESEDYEVVDAQLPDIIRNFKRMIYLESLIESHFASNVLAEFETLGNNIREDINEIMNLSEKEEYKYSKPKIFEILSNVLVTSAAIVTRVIDISTSRSVSQSEAAQTGLAEISTPGDTPRTPDQIYRAKERAKAEAARRKLRLMQQQKGRVRTKTPESQLAAIKRHQERGGSDAQTAARERAREAHRRDREETEKANTSTRKAVNMQGFRFRQEEARLWNDLVLNQSVSDDNVAKYFNYLKGRRVGIARLILGTYAKIGEALGKETGEIQRIVNDRAAQLIQESIDSLDSVGNDLKVKAKSVRDPGQLKRAQEAIGWLDIYVSEYRKVVQEEAGKVVKRPEQAQAEKIEAVLHLADIFYKVSSSTAVR